MVLVYHLAPGFLSLLLTKERKDKSEEGRGMGEDKTRERERGWLLESADRLLHHYAWYIAAVRATVLITPDGDKFRCNRDACARVYGIYTVTITTENTWLRFVNLFPPRNAALRWLEAARGPDACTIVSKGVATRNNPDVSLLRLSISFVFFFFLLKTQFPW